jgi:hypothetical protein
MLRHRAFAAVRVGVRLFTNRTIGMSAMLCVSTTTSPAAFRIIFPAVSLYMRVQDVDSIFDPQLFERQTPGEFGSVAEIHRQPFRSKI